MRILAFNSGSSSLKFQLFDVVSHVSTSILRGNVRGLDGETSCEWTYRGKQETELLSATDHESATIQVLSLLQHRISPGEALLDSNLAIGHRIVHGGDTYSAPLLMSDKILTALEALNSLAPLHNPPALAVARACRAYFTDVPMVAVFDTAFFQALPNYSRAYALPAEWVNQSQRIRRYGFHGLAHRYMLERFCQFSGSDIAMSRVITLQLGHGCSVAAIHGGQPVETSMGFTPLEGLIMATRPGDVDVGVVVHLLESNTVTLRELSDGLNHRAGLLGLSGISSDMKVLLELEAEGHGGASHAIQAFCHRTRKYIGAYLAVLRGADAIIFGGGIGEHAATIRERICSGMEWCGLILNVSANESAIGREACISTSTSHLAAYVVPVDEELLIAQETLNCL